MKILKGILAIGLVLTLFSCGLFDSGSDQEDSDPRKGSGEIKDYNGGAQDLFAPTLEIDDNLNSLAIDKVGTIDSNGKFEFELPETLSPQETVREFFVLSGCSLEINNGDAKVSAVVNFEVGLDTGILMQASSQEAVPRIFDPIFGGIAKKGDGYITRYYLDAEASVKGKCEETGTDNKAEFNLEFKKGWNYALFTFTEFISLDNFTIKLETKNTTNLEWFFYSVKDEISSISVEKTANPTSIEEPGGNIEFTVKVTNTSAVDAITLTTIADDENNDGTNDQTYNATDICLTTSLAPAESTTCSFSHDVTGKAGEIITNKVTVNGTDNEGDAVSASDTAEVTIKASTSSITVKKTANPISIGEPGGSVEFTVKVTNTSTVDTITLTTITDDENNDGTDDKIYNATDICLTTSLAPLESTTCGFNHDVTGKAGDTITNKVTVNGTDDEDDEVNASDTAEVAISDGDLVYKLTAFDGADGDYFGQSVAILGDIAVVGSLLNSAYIYERNTSGKWVLIKKIVASDGAADDEFGVSVAISGDTVVVGATFGDGNNSNSGSAYVFERDFGGSNNWGEVKKIVASDGAVDDLFGRSVAISGDVVVVGANRDDNTSTDSGSAYIFERNKGGNNNWGQTKKILASDGADGDLFGFSVTVSGDSVVVGARWNDDDGFNSGSAYIFERNKGGNDNWGEVKKILASDGAVVDFFGTSVVIDVDTLVVGALFSDGKDVNSGSVYIFKRDQGGNNNWGQAKKIVASDGATNDEFGASIAISGDTVVVGASRDNYNGEFSGSAYIYNRHQGGNENWGQVKKILAPDGVERDRFGISVAISGDAVVIGANEDDDNGSDSGSAYIFEQVGL